MTKRLLGWIGFLACVVMAAYYPVRFQQAVPPPGRLPAHQTYQAAVGRVLPDRIAQKASEMELSGYIIPVGPQQVTGLDHVTEDVNLALSHYPGWQVCVAPAVRDRMMKRAEQRFAKWGRMGIAREAARLMDRQKAMAFDVKYSAEMTWGWNGANTRPKSGPEARPDTGPDTGPELRAGVPKGSISNHSINDMHLTVTVNSEIDQARLFDVKVTFAHPETLARMTERLAADLAAYSFLENRARMGTTALYVLAGLAAVFGLSLLIKDQVRRSRDKAHKQYLLAQIETREDLINEGHYVAAAELAESYLAHFPHDTQIKAFLNRLYDFTNQDPQKAQAAFVALKKLQRRLASAAGGTSAATAGSIRLSDEEKEKLAPLLPYHPELENSFQQLIEMDDAALRQRTANATEALAQVTATLATGDIETALDQLRPLSETYADVPAVADMAGRLTKPGPTVFQLVPKAGGPLLEVIVKDRVAIGQALGSLSPAGQAMNQGSVNQPANQPDIRIPDRRVSRNHAVIFQKAGKIGVADENSANGTFVDGKPVEDAVFLAHGSLLTLGKVIDFTCSLYETPEGNATGLVLTGLNRHLVIVWSRLCFDLTADRIICPGTRITLGSSSGIVLAASNGIANLIRIGDRIELDGRIYHVEA